MNENVRKEDNDCLKWVEGKYFRSSEVTIVSTWIDLFTYVLEQSLHYSLSDF